MISIPKGTKDMLPADAGKWHYVEGIARETAALFGFKEIRTPIFEHTELFLRGVGETTDIVNKEMYTFEDKGGRSLTLRPEGTAGVARCFVENGLAQGVLPMKVYYLAPVFRYERPQNGRLREHHQFGVELFGSEAPSADVEVIALGRSFLSRAGLEELALNVNSIGCRDCRKEYNAALRAYIGSKLAQMCPQCRERFDKNPLRILDCKERGCRAVTADAPKTLDYLCPDCASHFEGVKSGLDELGIPYCVNPSIVRGLDYYTRTVFEFISTDIGAQGTVCGGGRYNHLVEEVGGKPMPAAGFGLGLERLLMVLANLNKLDGRDERVKLYIAPIGEAAERKAAQLASRLRAAGISCEYDLMSRSVKAQMKYADKSGAEYTLALGDDEIQRGVVRLRNMATGESVELELKALTEFFAK